MSGLDDSGLSLSSLPTVGEPAPVRNRAESGEVDALFGTLSDLGFGPDSSFSSALESPASTGQAARSRPRISSYSDLIDISPAFFEPPPVAPEPTDDSAQFSLLLVESQGVPPAPAVRPRSESRLPVVDIPSGFFDRVEDDRAIALEPEPGQKSAPTSSASTPSSRHASAAYPPASRASEGALRSVTSSRDERLVVPRAVADVRRPRPDSALHRAVAERAAAGSAVRRPAVRVSSASPESGALPASSANFARNAPCFAQAPQVVAPPPAAPRAPSSRPGAHARRVGAQASSAPPAALGDTSTVSLHFPALPPVPAHGVPATLGVALEDSQDPRAVAPSPMATPRAQSTALAPNVSALLGGPSPLHSGTRAPSADRTATAHPAPRRAVPPPTGDTTQFSIPNPAAAPRPVTPSVEDVSWERIIESATSVRSSRSSSAEHAAIGATGTQRRNGDR